MVICIQNFFDKEKLMNTFEFLSYYNQLLNNYQQTPSQTGSQELQKAYEKGKKGKFKVKEIYSYSELKSLAKELFFN